MALLFFLDIRWVKFLFQIIMIESVMNLLNTAKVVVLHLDIPSEIPLLILYKSYKKGKIYQHRLLLDSFHSSIIHTHLQQHGLRIQVPCQVHS